MKVSIVAVLYEEPEYKATKACIEAVSDLVQEIVYVDRKGVGSLAKAYNDGFVQLEETDYVWFVSNITFTREDLFELVKAMAKGYAAIHPCFDSDHQHIRPNTTGKVVSAPFVEFTSPMVRYDVFYDHRLDEKLPYWGHDIDWSYRIKHEGHRMAIHHGVEVGHVYMRNSYPHVITRRRKVLRRKADSGTRLRLKELYGDTWRGVLFPGEGSSVTKFYENVSEKILK